MRAVCVRGRQPSDLNKNLNISTAGEVFFGGAYARGRAYLRDTTACHITTCRTHIWHSTDKNVAKNFKCMYKQIDLPLRKGCFQGYSTAVLTIDPRSTEICISQHISGMLVVWLDHNVCVVYEISGTTIHSHMAWYICASIMCMMYTPIHHNAWHACYTYHMQSSHM